jgi:predicted transcriptional regulator of viral defense system
MQLTGTMPLFDFSLLAQAFDDPREVIRVQLSRWMKQGRVLGLRRGVYTLAERYRSMPLTPAALANAIYRPSYLSGLWALGFYDLIPERVVWLTSVTSRPPHRYENPFGVFDYRNIKPGGFFGYRTAPYGGGDIVVAEPEKAILDHWHLTPGEWTTARLEEMRYQNVSLIGEDRLRAFAQRFHSPRLDRAAIRWLELAARDITATESL